jgi:TPR repeat protein
VNAPSERRFVTFLKATFGDADAQYRLAALAWAIDRDPRRAIRWARRAMRNGAPDAFMLMTQIALDSGHEAAGIEGIVLGWRQAAEAGDAGAQFFLGQCHERGDFGVPRDQQLALQWYTKAALGGDEDAAAAVARLCSTPGGGDGLK